MKRNNRILLILTVIVICFIASFPLWHNKIDFEHQAGQVTQVKKKKPKKSVKKVKVTWGYPFKKMYEKKIKFKSGQEFGETDVMRRIKPKSYFHDGFDFGFSEVGHKPVYAVHSGTVHKVKFRP